MSDCPPFQHVWDALPYKTEDGKDYYKCTVAGCTAENWITSLDLPDMQPSEEETNEDKRVHSDD